MALSGNAETIAQYLASKGFSAAGVAGVLGTWQAESGLNPNATNRSSGAHGLAQWLGSRLGALETFAHLTGGDVNNIATQLGYFWEEITTPEYANLLHELQTTTNPQQAARDFVNVYERPGPGGDASAPSNAQVFFNGGTPGGSGTPGGTRPGSPPINAGTTVSGSADVGTISLAGMIFNEAGTFVNAFLLLFKPSFWLRVGAFIGGFILFILGINEFRHAV